MATIGIVADDVDTLVSLDLHLRQAGFETVLAATPDQLLALVNRGAPRLLLLDTSRPSPIALCARVKADPAVAHVPVIICSDRGAESDRVAGLEAGADDYVTKPYSVRELVLRIRAVLRHFGERPRPIPGPRRAGPIRIDADAHRAFVADQELALTPTEFRLLAALLDGGGRVLPRHELLARVWGNGDGASRTIDTHVRRLREKLGAASGLVACVRGVGYRLAAPVAPAPVPPPTGVPR